MVTLLLGIISLAGFCTFVYHLSRNVLFGLYCLLAVNFISVALGLDQATVGGLHLDAGDLLGISLLAAGILRFCYRMKLPGTSRIMILAYLAIFGASLFRGIALFGLQPASNEARGFVGSILAMLYFFTMPSDHQTIKKILTAYLYFGVGLVVVAILHYAGLNVGTAVVDEKDRALPSASGESIALCFFIGLGWITHRRSPQVLRWLLPIFAGMVIFLQHRTVWTVMAVCCMAIFFIDIKLVRRLIPLAALASIIAVSLAVAIYRTGTDASTQFEDSATNAGTWNWRVEAWQRYISDEAQTVPSIMFGKPLGSGFVRFDSASGGFEEAPPHSEYVTQYLRVGIIGLPIFLAFLLRPLLKLYQLQRKRPLALFPSVSVWCLIIIATLVYGVTYGYDAPAIALIGIANSALLSVNSQSYTEPESVSSLGVHPAAAQT
jgi:hypothetical protein